MLVIFLIRLSKLLVVVKVKAVGDFNEIKPCVESNHSSLARLEALPLDDKVLEFAFWKKMSIVMSQMFEVLSQLLSN